MPTAQQQRAPIDIFDTEASYGGGGTYFADGLYRIESSRFGYFDFKKPGNEALCLILAVQPLDAKGADEGELQVQYWPIGDTDKQGTRTVEPCTPVKGEKGLYAQIRLTEANTHDKLFAFSDFAIFMQHLKKAEYDMDAAGNDITALDGLVAEFGKVVKAAKKQSAVAIAEEGDKGGAPAQPKEVIVITSIPRVPAKGQAKGTPLAANKVIDVKAEKVPDKPAGKGKAKELDPEQIVADYLVENALTEENEADGTPFLIHRMALSKYVSKDLALPAEAVRAVMAIFNDEAQLGAILTAAGWERAGKLIIKSK
jgi:hypothetical protein